MIVQANVPFFRLTKELWPIITLVTAYSVTISLVDHEFRLTNKMDGLATLPGALLGILLAFRTNACYNRWWEARILWGKIVNDSRSWVRQLLEFGMPSQPANTREVLPAVVRMAHRQIAWCYTLARSLRGQDPVQDVGDILSQKELEQIGKQLNLPNALLLNQARDLRELRNQEQIDAYQFVRLEETLSRLTDSMEVLPAVVRMAHRQIAWCYTLARSLRGQDPVQDVGDILSQKELEQIGKQLNLPNALLLNQARDLRELRNQEQIDAYQFVRLEETLSRLTDSMGGCERIRNTPFPQSYQLWIKYLIYLFILFLPFAMVELPWYGLILATVPIASGFLIIDRVATYLEDPFLHRASSTPMLTLSRTIEINIRQMLDEPDAPPMMKPVEGVLY